MSYQLQLPVARAELARAVARSIQLVSFGLNAANTHSPRDHTVPGAQVQLALDQGAATIPAGRARTAFRRWVLANGLRDCVESLGAALGAGRFEAWLWSQPGTVSRREDGRLELTSEFPVDAWIRQSGDGARRFDRLTLPEKMTRLERTFGLQRPAFADDVLSIHVARNCLTHRAGVVGEEDVDSHRDFMTVRWHRWRIEAVDIVQREVRIPAQFDQPTRLSLSLVPRRRRFRLGRPVSFNAAEYTEIATTLVLYGDQLQQSINRKQEARFADQQERKGESRPDIPL